MNHPTTRALGTVLWLVALAGCAGQRSPPAVSQRRALPADLPPAVLVARIVDAPDLRDVAAATREALARGGVATVDSTEIRTRALEPAASTTASSAEVANLAVEARRRPTAGRITAARLGKMLQDFAFPFVLDTAPVPGDTTPVAVDTTPGGQLVRFLGTWVTEARLAPDDPRNFTPLFLAAMAGRQLPPIDLAAGTGHPGQVRFSLLELELLSAAFDRIMKLPDSTGTGVRKTEAARDEGPCTGFKKRLGTAVGEGGAVAVDERISQAFNNALKRHFSETTARNLSRMVQATHSLAKIWKLVAFYASGEASLTVISDNPMHKPGPAEDSLLAAFRVRAGVSEEDFQKYLEDLGGAAAAAVRQAEIDCMNSVGIVNLGDLGEIAQNAENWRVEWRLLNEDGSLHEIEHAMITRSRNDSLDSHNRGPMRRHDATSAQAVLVVDLTHEKKPGHSGRLRTAGVTAQAEIIASKPPDLGTLVSAWQGLLGLAESLAELGAGWIQEALPPKAYATLKIEYHIDEPRQYRLLMRNSWAETVNDAFGRPVHQTGDEVHEEVALAFQPGSQTGYAGSTEFSANYSND